MSSVKSIAEAYSQYGSEGLTEKGKNVRLGGIISATVGTALIITGIVLFILLFTHARLFPSSASVLGVAYSSVICISGGAGLIIAAYEILNNFKADEYVEANPPIKYVKVIPDLRTNDL